MGLPTVKFGKPFSVNSSKCVNRIEKVRSLELESIQVRKHQDYSTI